MTMVMVVVVVMVGMTRMNFFEGKEWGKGGGGNKEGEFICKNTLYIYWYISLGVEDHLVSHWGEICCKGWGRSGGGCCDGKCRSMLAVVNVKNFTFICVLQNKQKTKVHKEGEYYFVMVNLGKVMAM
jgi:hypothetical protein